jgi:endonuclease/exonuclease/phosphatase family metal-dependent hydrolase
MLEALALAAAMSIDLRVMSYNIWVGGTRSQPLSQTIRAVQRSGADIIGIQEPGPNLEAIAEGAGMTAVPEAAIITSYKVVRAWDVPQVNWGGAELEAPDGRRIFAYNCHLTAYPYGPYEVRDGNAKTEAEAAAVEEAAGRLPQVKRLLADIAQRVPANAAVVFTGDFNAPSHRDWAKPTARTFNMAVNWPVSRAVEDAGFIDTYRAVHPDPIQTPGFTWSPGYPVPEIAEDDVMDRIDFVYSRGPLKVVDALVFAERGPVSDLALDPWPSDHRAVIAHFSWPR